MRLFYQLSGPSLRIFIMSYPPNTPAIQRDYEVWLLDVAQDHHRIANDVCKPDGFSEGTDLQKKPRRSGAAKWEERRPKRTTIR